MQEGSLLADLIKNAERIRIKYSNTYITAPTFIMATAEFCSTRYIGFTKYDANIYPERFEEERLRQMFKRVFSVRPNTANILLRRKARTDADEYRINFLPRALKIASEIAKKRGKTEVSPEVVLLIAASTLCDDERRILKPEFCDGVLPIAQLLTELDATVADNVIEDLKNIIFQLNNKITEVEAIRDWKPAVAFGDTEEFISLLKSKISYNFLDMELHLRIAGFFGDEQDLELSIICFDDTFYVNDNGGAIEYLKKHLSKGEDHLKYVYKVCSKKWIVDDKVYGHFCQPYAFTSYLSNLIFIANADLVGSKMSRQRYPRDDVKIVYSAENAWEFDPCDFLGKLFDQLAAKYDEYKGVDVELFLLYPRGSRTAAFNIQVVEEGVVSITDMYRKELEGAIFERFYADYSDLERHKNFINNVGSRFNAYFDGISITSTVSYKNVDDVAAAFIKFLNAAILLSEVGNRIDPSKI